MFLNLAFGQVGEKNSGKDWVIWFVSFTLVCVEIVLTKSLSTGC